MLNKIFAIFFIVFVSNVFSQHFNVEYQKLEGSLTSTDLSKKNFGRYDGFQMPMNENEAAYFIIYAENFSPSLVLIDPNNELYQQAPAKGEDYVSMGVLVPYSGDWVLYVVGDSSAHGNYVLQYAFADSASLFLDNNQDFCTGFSYLLAHANAYFAFPQTFPTKKPLFKFKNAVDAFINGDDASYNSVFYQGDRKTEADNSYNSLVEKVTSCVPNSWKQKKGSETIDDTGTENFVTWTESVNNNPRYIKVSITEYSEEDSSTEYLDKYSVDLTIMRN